MGQLTVDDFVAVAQTLLDDTHRQGAEPVPCHLSAITHALEGGENTKLGCRLSVVALVREQVLVLASDGVQFPQQGPALARQKTWWLTLRGLTFFFSIFMRCQSITHDSFSRSISDQGVSVSSLVRTKVIIMSLNMTLVGTNMRPSIFSNVQMNSGRSSGVIAAW